MPGLNIVPRLLAVCVATGSWAGADTDTDAGRFSARMREVLELREVDCPERLQPAAGRVARCAVFRGDFGDWKALWEDTLRRFDLPSHPVSAEPWVTAADEPEIYTRRYAFGDRELDVRFEEGGGLVAFSFEWDGPDEAAENAERLAEPRPAGFAGVDVPEPLQQPAPAYPTAAEGSGITGQVALEIVVGTDGAVGNITVLREEPREKGFADYVVAAVKRWTYKPVEVAGAPVPVRMPVYVSVPPPADDE